MCWKNPYEFKMLKRHVKYRIAGIKKICCWLREWFNNSEICWSIDKSIKREARELILTEKRSQVSLSFVELLGVFEVASNIDKIEEYSEQHGHDNDIENIWLNWKSMCGRGTDGGRWHFRVPRFKSHISSKVSATMRTRQSSKTIGNGPWLSLHLLSNNRCSIMHETKMLEFLRLFGNYFSPTICRRMSLWYSCDFYLFTTDCFILFDIIHTIYMETRVVHGLSKWDTIFK